MMAPLPNGSCCGILLELFVPFLLRSASASANGSLMLASWSRPILLLVSLSFVAACEELVPPPQETAPVVAPVKKKAVAAPAPVKKKPPVIVFDDGGSGGGGWN